LVLSVSVCFLCLENFLAYTLDLRIASYLPLIKHLRTLLARNRKKSYTISVGKLNPSKLANFLEIECFVLVACPENSLIDSKV